MKLELPDHEVVEVVLWKEMTVENYKKIFSDSKNKGWKIQAFQKNQY